jgi:DNA-binding XRE family transcriptional regulator
MKMRHTENFTEIIVSLPGADDMGLGRAIKDKIVDMGHTVQERLVNDEGEELYTFEEAFPEAHPGMILRGFRSLEDMTQAELAARLGVAQTRVSELESGKRRISLKMAKQLASIFGTSYKSFL